MSPQTGTPPGVLVRVLYEPVTWEVTPIMEVTIDWPYTPTLAQLAHTVESLARLDRVRDGSTLPGRTAGAEMQSRIDDARDALDTLEQQLHADLT